MKIRKSYILLLLGVSLLIACGNSYEEQKRISRAEKLRLAKEDSLALKVAVMPTLDCLPVYIMKEQQLYDSTKLDLRLRAFASQMDCDTAVIKNRVEGMVTDLVRANRIMNRGIALRYFSVTNSYWQLIANRTARIRQLNQLGDKMVAMSRFSATDYLTDKALDTVKTKAQVFRIQINSVNIRLHMLLNNEMDALWLTEPQATKARLMGHNVIADSREMNSQLGVFVFREDEMKDERRQKQLKEFTKWYNAACDSINKNGLKAYSEVIRKYMKADEKTINALPKIVFKHASSPLQSDINKVKDL
jgi:NitT/TauT family transport system substrate-binding protein